MLLKSDLTRAGMLLAVAVVAALIFNGVSPDGIPLFGQWDTAQGVVNAGDRAGFVDVDREIRTVSQARAMFDEGAAVFVDARSADAYAEGHIPGAISLPVNDFDEKIPKFWERYPLQEEIVTYCSGRTCEDGHHLARLLEEVGYERVRVFIDGYPGWAAAGYPVSTTGQSEAEAAAR
jgi:rhodanese-related sulfurtransferase